MENISGGTPTRFDQTVVMHSIRINDIENSLIIQSCGVTKDDVFRVDEFETVAETTRLLFGRNIEGDT